MPDFPRPDNNKKQPPEPNWLDLVPEVFKKLDTDNNRDLSDKELDLPLLADLRGAEAKAGAYLKMLQLTLREANRVQEDFKQPKLDTKINEAFVRQSVNLLRISQAEKKQLGDILKLAPIIEAPGELETLDRDKNGSISKDELERGLKASRGSSRQTVLFLTRNYDLLKNFNTDPKSGEVSLAAVYDFAYGASFHNRTGAFGASAVGFVHRLNSFVKPGTELFAPEKQARDSINGRSVIQGYSGDCFFLSALAGLADKNPDAIAKMIEQKGRNSYVVRFPAAPDLAIKCSISEAESIVFAAGTANGAWPTVMEKAFAELLKQREKFRPDVFAADLPGAEALDLGGAGQGLHALTGKEPTVVDFEVGKPDTKKQYDKALDLLADGKRKVVAMAHSNFDCDRAILTPGHVFTVVRVDDKTVTVRNPWGVSKPPASTSQVDTSNGLQTFRRSDFYKLFGRITYVELK